jgi:hypothetical protein
MKPELLPAAKQFLMAKLREERGLDRDPTDQELKDWALAKWSSRRGSGDSMSSAQKSRPGGR